METEKNPGQQLLNESKFSAVSILLITIYSVWIQNRVDLKGGTVIIT